MKSLTARESRLLAIAILLAVIAVCWLGVVQPITAGFADRAQRREELRRAFSANVRLTNRIPRLRRAAEQAEALRHAYGIAAPDPVQAADRLRERMEAALASAGGELKSSEAMEAEQGWVRARVSGTLGNAQMIAWLGNLSASPPYLSIENLTVAADRAANSSELDLMDVQIEATIPVLAPHKR